VDVIRSNEPISYIRDSIVEDVGNGLVVNQYIRFNTVAVLLMSSAFAALEFNNTKLCWSNWSTKTVYQESYAKTKELVIKMNARIEQTQVFLKAETQRCP
jgi:hypothetical protein